MKYIKKLLNTKKLNMETFPVEQGKFRIPGSQAGRIEGKFSQSKQPVEFQFKVLMAGDFWLRGSREFPSFGVSSFPDVVYVIMVSREGSMSEGPQKCLQEINSFCLDSWEKQVFLIEKEGSLSRYITDMVSLWRPIFLHKK